MIVSAIPLVFWWKVTNYARDHVRAQLKYVAQLLCTNGSVTIHGSK